MADEERAMFDSALEDAAPTSEPAPEPEGQPRDERGRFSSSQPAEIVETPPAPAEPATPAPTAQEPQPQAQGIPPWRLKEEADARRAAEAELAELRRELAQSRQPKQPDPVPDLYENPTAFVDHGVKQHIDPVKSEIATLREFYSRKEAIREHGAEKVTAAYNALDQGIRSRDPEAIMIYQRAMNSMDPFGDIMSWHQKQTLFSQVGSDPNAWFEKQLEERLKDPAHQAKLMERIRGNVQQQPNRPPVTQLPPSLNKATASVSPGEDDEDGGEAGLLKSALRR
jgi:hypothetical protein